MHETDFEADATHELEAQKPNRRLDEVHICLVFLWLNWGKTPQKIRFTEYFLSYVTKSA